MTASRLATDDEIESWRRDGWVVLDGLVGEAEIDGAVPDVFEVFPTPEQYHADPAKAIEAWGFRVPGVGHSYVWPAKGPGFRPDQHRWAKEFPFPGTGALNRLCVHPSVIDFVERAMGTEDVRIYQSQISAKYEGETNYEQPMHLDRNHSWLPPKSQAPWWHVEGFLYLSDVDDETMPTHLVAVGDSEGRRRTVPLVMPRDDRELYAAERPARGRRGSFLAYRTDVFHRAVNLTGRGGSRFLLNISYKVAGQDWVGYHAWQSRANWPDLARFIEGSTPRELAVFGFPPPGHAIWDAELLDATAERYPKLDLTPWREALRG